MKKIYNQSLLQFFFRKVKLSGKLFSVKCFFTLTFLCIMQLFTSPALIAQKLEFSYSYINITRGIGGGTLEQGDIIEVRALVKVNAITNNFYYIDTMRTGTQYVTNTLKIVTNEGLTYQGPFTNAPLDDKGVYATTGGIGRVRVNIGTGAANPDNGIATFGVNTGGGTITPGVNKPLFYGKTLLVVAYRLLITANYGDTIHLTGNFYVDTSGVKTTYRFNYPGIKIIQNQALCNNFSSASFTADSSFKSGNTQNRALPAIVPGYIKVNMGANAPVDNYYAIANNTSSNGTTNNAGPYVPIPNPNRVFGGYWDIIGDHTGAASPVIGNPPTPAGQPGGYMLVVNAAYPAGEAFRDTIKNVCPNTYYEFSAWIRNICGKCGIDSNSNSTYTPGVLPNLAYAINDVDYFTTGNIAYDQKWVKRGFIYKTGPTETQFNITIKNNAAGGGGNDWVIDDIKLATCYPNLIMNPSDTATSCVGYPVYLSDTVKSYFNNYTNWCWEKSSDAITWASTGVCGTRIPSLVNGQWVYNVDTTFISVQADSGKYYRLKVATTFPNVSNISCAVDNSQKIFLKVYSVSCSVLTSKLLTFAGNNLNEKAILKWSTDNEEGIKEYEIQKSTDGVHFLRLGIISSNQSANGSSYIFYDPEFNLNLSYYRLKLVSASNNADIYSKIIVLGNRSSFVKVSIVNPFKNNLKIDITVSEDGKLSLNLYDIYGRIVSNKKMQLSKGNTKVELENIDNLSSGIYILNTSFNNLLVKNKLMKTE
ncbi:MAG TPA: T9SS type A sorting domain-containing protein [Chitinophagaceae bacterium]|nr:T9SS type A sorting domain-containing protein [Chitinophagaceae bacterium]